MKNELVLRGANLDEATQKAIADLHPMKPAFVLTARERRAVSHSKRAWVYCAG